MTVSESMPEAIFPVKQINKLKASKLLKKSALKEKFELITLFLHENRNF